MNMHPPIIASSYGPEQALMPDDFTRQEKSAATQWGQPNNLPMHSLNPLRDNAP